MMLIIWWWSLAAVVVSRASFLQGVTTILSSVSSLELAVLQDKQYPPADAADPLFVLLAEESTRFRFQIADLVTTDPSLAGPLLRLAFHDATTRDSDIGGPNGSIRYEVPRSENRGIGKPLALVQGIIKNNESYASSSISLADAIALAGAQAVETVGGPHIAIRLGRQDVDRADPEYYSTLKNKKPAAPRSVVVAKTLPSAGLDADGLRLYFGRLGLSEAEFVALSGSHAMGRHVSLLGMPKECLKNLTRTCLEDAPVLLPFVTKSVDTFDNSYFQALLKWNRNQVELGDVAFLPTDVALVVDAGLRRQVERFAKDPQEYSRVFARAYQKLVDPAPTATTTTARRY
jgi:catalase (peroxidase I)